MLFSLLLVFSFLVPGNSVNQTDFIRSYLPYFAVDVRYNIHEKCAGMLIAERNVLVVYCDFLSRRDLEIQNITMKISKHTRKVKNIKRFSDVFEDGIKTLPLYVLQADIGFFGNISPIALNGGDLLETCEAVMIRKYLLGVKENEVLNKTVNPLPYEVCKRKIPEMKFSTLNLCVIDNGVDDGFFEPGSPMLCNEYLTGLKLQSRPLGGKKNLTVHIYIRVAKLINWFMENINGDSPNWVILESDYEEKAIIGNQVRMEFRNNGNTQYSQWILSAQAVLFHYLNKFIKYSIFYF